MFPSCGRVFRGRREFGFCQYQWPDWYVQIEYILPNPERASTVRLYSILPDHHELLTSFGRAGVLASFALARIATGACRHALHRHRPCCALLATAWRRLAVRHPHRIIAAAARHRRNAPAAPGPASLRRAPHRAAAAAPCTASPGAGRAGPASFATVVAAYQPQRRRAMGGRTGAAQRQLRRAAVLGRPCPGRKPAPPAHGGAKRRNPVFHAPPAGRSARRFACTLAPGAAPGGRRHEYRVRQTPGTAARRAAVPASHSFFTATTCVCGSACPCPS